MFGLHWQELSLVVVIGMLFFGPKRLPEIGSSIGRTIKEFQRSMKEVTDSTPAPAAAVPPSEQQQQQIAMPTSAPMAPLLAAQPGVTPESPELVEGSATD